MSGAGCEARAAYDKKEQTPLSARFLSSHPLAYFTAVFSVFQAHLPVPDMVSQAKPLEWRNSEWGDEREIRQYRPASLVIERSTGLTVAPCTATVKNGD